MVIDKGFTKLQVDALRGRKCGLKVRCMIPDCPLRCSLTFETPAGFSSVSADTLVVAFSSLCTRLAKVAGRQVVTSGQTSLL